MSMKPIYDYVSDMRPFLKRAMIALMQACALCAAAPALSQQYPARPIRFIVPFPPGGTLDITARIMQPKLSENLRQPILIENPGPPARLLGPDPADRNAPHRHPVLF